MRAFGQGYGKYALPRILGEREVFRVAEYQGVPLFAEAGRTEQPQVIYVPWQRVSVPAVSDGDD
jgi:hypothetical protein